MIRESDFDTEGSVKNGGRGLPKFHSSVFKKCGSLVELIKWVFLFSSQFSSIDFFLNGAI